MTKPAKNAPVAMEVLKAAHDVSIAQAKLVTAIDKETGIEFIDASPEASQEAIESAAIAAMPPTDDNLSFETYVAKAVAYGELRGSADDTMAMLAIDITDGSKAGKIDNRTSKEKAKANSADTRDDIEFLLNKYIEARGLKAVHERKGNSLDNKKAQLRRFADLGKLVDVNGPDVLADVVARYKSTYLKADTEGKKGLNDAFTSYLNAARMQIDQPKKALSDEQIGECIAKKSDPKRRNVATIWTQIADAAKALTDGSKKLTDGTVIVDNSVEGAELAAKIVAYAKRKQDELALADNEAENARLRAQMVANGGEATA
jgi:hypothetical protein